MNLRRLFRRSQEDSELSEELESHLAHEIDDNLARGMSPEEAQAAGVCEAGQSASHPRQSLGDESHRVAGRYLARSALCRAHAEEVSQFHSVSRCW